jgi:very-short-patch-repair endonuclease
MGRKLTQEEAKKKSFDVGVRMVGKYINKRTKTKFECPFCENIFVNFPRSVWDYSVKSCGCINKYTQQTAKNKSLEVNIKMVGIYKGSNIKTEFECPKCKNIFSCTPNAIWSQSTKSCGCIRGLKLILTQKEVQQKNLNMGINMIGVYINSQTKTEFECPICKKIFYISPSEMWSKHTKSCGHCNDPSVGDKFGKLTIVKIIPGKHSGCRVIAKCECGNSWTGSANRLRNHRTKSCGCCNDPTIGDKFNKLTIIKIISNYRGDKSNIEAMCECGKIWKGKFNQVKNNNTKSCGHCNDPKIGDRFGTLIVVQVIPSKYIGCKIIAKCKCGHLWKGRYSALTKPNNQTILSCGNCKLYKNGKLTSYISVSLGRFLPIYAQHNYKFDKKHITRCVDWAFVYKGKKIALEYDEWYWHGYRIPEDKKRYKSLIKKGWKVIQIRAHGNIPTQQQINEALSKIEHGRKKVTITLKGWGQGQTFINRKKKDTINNKGIK